MSEVSGKTHSGYRAVRRAILGSLIALWAVLAVLQWSLFSAGAGGSLLETMGAFALVNVNILLLLLLLFLTLRNIAKLVFERRTNMLGSKLKTKLILAFLATTIIPTLILFVASAGFLASSIDGWFSARVKDALENAMQVARAYYSAEEEAVLGSARQLVAELSPKTFDGPNGLARELAAAAKRHRVDGVALISPEGKRVQAGSAPLASEPDPKAVREALEGKETVLHLDTGTADVMRVYAPLRRHPLDAPRGALVADRRVPVQSFQRLKQITSGFEEYRQGEHLRAAIKASYIFPLLLVALLITFAVTWFGFYLARTITEPIGALADATARIAGGDLDFQLEVSSRDEVGTLVKSFNLMTRDLKQSRERVETARRTLTQANDELVAWRLYMGAVMDKVSAGVVGADAVGCITTMNPAARQMLGVKGDPTGKHYREVLSPEALAVLDTLFEEKLRKGTDDVRRQVLLPGEGMGRTAMIHLTALRDERGTPLGTVVVLNDLTDLVKAERAQAWREVARRIAHEIKNPLTPIQLSAQRLRRRYGELLEEADGEVLDEATRTIITQVDGLKNLVNEFSRFAKMPEANPVPSRLNALVEEVLGLYRPAHPEIRFDVRLGEPMPILELDPEQIKRALVNLLDNAVAAVAEQEHKLVELSTELDPERNLARLAVADNGHGLSPKAREHLFEPYFSTKKGGTGLGLAIVKSIVADHKGYVRALDNKPQGTRFLLEFPLPGAEA